MTTVHPEAVALIKRFEGCKLSPECPGGSSGVTLGWGSDIGADPDSLDAWQDHLTPDELARLQPARGITGPAARALLPGLADISYSQDAADAVFATYALPKFLAQTLRAFPGADGLPPKSLGALVSLIYNRGASTSGSRRAEMAEVKALLNSRAWDMIPVEFAEMAKYWPDSNGPTASNLCGRRYAEGHLFESGLRDAGLADAEALLLGDSGDRVRALQTAIKAKVDGSFGPATLRVLLAWQGLQKLPPHGIADLLTLRLLGLA